jgi:hypothetical protein
MTKSLALVAIVSSFFAAARTAKTEQREVRTPYYSLALTPDGTSIESLSVDSLGKGEFRPSVLFPLEAKPSAQAAVPADAIFSSDWQFKVRHFRLDVHGVENPAIPQCDAAGEVPQLVVPAGHNAAQCF